jgi:chaperone protein EcpD
MVAPEGKIEFMLKPVADHPLHGETLFYSVINDYGGESINEQVLGNNI